MQQHGLQHIGPSQVYHPVCLLKTSKYHCFSNQIPNVINVEQLRLLSFSLRVKTEYQIWSIGCKVWLMLFIINIAFQVTGVILVCTKKDYVSIIPLYHQNSTSKISQYFIACKLKTGLGVLSGCKTMKTKSVSRKRYSFVVTD